MKQIYEEVKTPYKYGMVVVPTDNKHLIDCPTIFRIKGKWYMSYIVYDGQQNKGGRGYETHLAVSDDLLNWKKMGHILSFPDANSKRWDKNQRAGYIALIDYNGEEVMNQKSLMVNIGCLILVEKFQVTKEDVSK